ncbi:unnamed protein product [Gadus morhua 'NCC']
MSAVESEGGAVLRVYDACKARIKNSHQGLQGTEQCVSHAACGAVPPRPQEVRAGVRGGTPGRASHGWLVLQSKQQPSTEGETHCLTPGGEYRE